MNRFDKKYGESWSLKKIGDYCVKLKQRTALDAWVLGRLFVIAKSKAKAKGRFTDWKRKHGFSNATVSRYVRLYKAFPTAEDRAHLVDIGVMKALEEANVVSGTEAPRREDRRQVAAGKPVAAAKKASPGGKSAVPSWAVDDDEEAQECRERMARDYKKYVSEQWSKSGSLLELCEKVIPWQIDNLWKNVELALEREGELRDAWSEDVKERKQMLLAIKSLMESLPRLAATVAVSRPQRKKKRAA